MQAITDYARGPAEERSYGDEAIARIEKHNPKLNAVIYKTYDQARAAAKKKLPDGPFKGVPFLLKDIMAFQTGVPGGDVARHLHADYISVYVPTTPNPTSGFFLMMPRADVIELDMNVDDALKYVISMGVVAPGDAQSAAPGNQPTAQPTAQPNP